MSMPLVLNAVKIPSPRRYLVAFFNQVSTESPDIVETFDPLQWNPEEIHIPQGPQIQIKNLFLDTKIRLRFARTRITANVYNPHDKPLQASFKINLPEDAFFTTFKLRRIGPRPKQYTASVMEKERAREIFHYAHIKTNGSISAGIIELWNENSLTSYNLKFTLGPKVQIEVYLVYESLIERMNGIYSDIVNVFPLQPAIVDFMQLTVDVQELERIKDLSFSDSHRKSNMHHLTEDGRRVELKWSAGNVSTNELYNHPFTFKYELDQHNTSSAVVISQRNGNVYFVHLFVPQHLPVMRKHIVFLLDVSDSMHGNKLDQLRWAMEEIFDDLAPHDFFNIVTFSTEVFVWSKFQAERKRCQFPFPGTEEYKEPARYFLKKQMSAHGRTNVYDGMSQAFDLIQLFSPQTNDSCKAEIRTPSLLRKKLDSKLPENVESMIFFLSDGIPTSGQRNTSILLKLFHQINYRLLTKPIPIYTIALGADADVHFLKAISSENGGIAKVIPETSDAGLELAKFYGEISSPVLSSVHATISANGSNITQFANYATPLLLLNGTEMLTPGQIFPNMEPVHHWSTTNLNFSIEALGKTGKLSYESPVYDCRTLDTTFDYCLEKIDMFLERLQAYNKLKKLIDRDRLIQDGYVCPKSVDDDIYSQIENISDNEIENQNEERQCFNPYKDLIIELAKQYKFVTPYTSFILCSDPKVDTGLKLKGQIDVSNIERKQSTDTTINVPNDQPQLAFVETKKVDDSSPSDTELREELEVLPLASKLISLGQFTDALRPSVRNISEEEFRPTPKTNLTSSLPTTNNTTQPQSKLVSNTVRDVTVGVFKRLFSI
ncbi:unnamed protein product [Orchesella dallaii]|uniref:VWFA domain-containing protein n=1 Tax=Orchesella dallaii TaxID=48710 RepID=A0ABP1S6K4_9HEXA